MPEFERCLKRCLAPAKALCSATPTRSTEANRPWMLGSEASRARAAKLEARAAAEAAARAAAQEAAAAVAGESVLSARSSFRGFRYAALHEEEDDDDQDTVVEEDPTVVARRRAHAVAAAERAQRAVSPWCVFGPSDEEATFWPVLEVTRTALEVATNVGDCR